MNGYLDNTFKPCDNITKGEMACAICKWKNIDLDLALDYNGTLSDIEGTWYEKYVKALYFLGYINGCDDNTFKGDDPIKRCEISVIFNKVLNIDVNSVSLAKENKYSDVTESDWYYKDVLASSMD